jgi:hypothetical protein
MNHSIVYIKFYKFNGMNVVIFLRFCLKIYSWPIKSQTYHLKFLNNVALYTPLDTTKQNINV